MGNVDVIVRDWYDALLYSLILLVDKFGLMGMTEKGNKEQENENMRMLKLAIEDFASIEIYMRGEKLISGEDNSSQYPGDKYMEENIKILVKAEEMNKETFVKAFNFTMNNLVEKATITAGLGAVEFLEGSDLCEVLKPFVVQAWLVYHMGTFAVNKGYWNKCFNLKTDEEELLKLKEKMKEAMKKQKLTIEK